MSEYASYSTTAMAGGTGGAVRESLKRRGIFFRDDLAWKTARERVGALESALREGLETRSEKCLHDTPLSSTQQEVAKSEAMLEAFCRIPEFKTFTNATQKRAFQDLQDEVASLTHYAESNNNKSGLLRCAHRAQKRIEQLAAGAQRGLCKIEKEVMVGAVSKGLNELGYMTEIRGDALKATLGQTCLWAEVNKWGELSIDISGFSGLSCTREMTRVEDQFRKQGLNLKRTASTRHGRPEGGKLVSRLQPLFPEFKIIQSGGENKRKITKVKTTKELIQS
jgi:hypothetical protein